MKKRKFEELSKRLDELNEKIAVVRWEVHSDIICANCGSRRIKVCKGEGFAPTDISCLDCNATAHHPSSFMTVGSPMPTPEEIDKYFSWHWKKVVQIDSDVEGER